MVTLKICFAFNMEHFLLEFFLGERERYDLNIYIIINQEILLYENVKNV